MWRVRELKYQIKWAWQRLFRGYDDRVWWNLNSYLCKMLPVWLRKIKTGHLHPADLTEEAWEAMLEEMADGFEEGYYLMDIGDGDAEKFERAMKLFIERIFDLWD